MLRIALRVLAVLAVFAFTVFLIPSSVPFAGAEEAIPEYEPVELAATSVEPLEMGAISTTRFLCRLRPPGPMIPRCF